MVPTTLPRPTFREWPIDTRMPVRTGPVHGDAMTAVTRPSTKAPRYPMPPTDDNRRMTALGKTISNAPPDIDAAERDKDGDNSADDPAIGKLRPKTGSPYAPLP